MHIENLRYLPHSSSGSVVHQREQLAMDIVSWWRGSQRRRAVTLTWENGRAANGRDSYTVWFASGCQRMTIRQLAGKRGAAMVRMYYEKREWREAQRCRLAIVGMAEFVLRAYVPVTGRVTA